MTRAPRTRHFAQVELSGGTVDRGHRASVEGCAAADPLAMNCGQRPAQPEGGERQMLTTIRARFAREEGQTMAEYAVVLAVITVATVAVFTALSGGITSALNNVTVIL